MKRKFWKTSCTLYIKRAIAWPPPFHLSHNGHLAANLINFVLACYVPRVHQPEWPHWLNSCISHATAAAAKGRGGQTGRKEEVAGKIRPERAVTVTAERQLAAHHNQVHQVLVLAFRFQLIFIFLSHFRAFSARGETPEDEVLNASSQKELEWKICKKRIHRILFHMHGDTLIPFVSQKQSQSKRYKGHLAQLLVIFP